MLNIPLRAYLMVRSDEGIWTVTVYRDLTNIVLAWKSQKNPEKFVGVLHVGFERHPSKTYEEIAQSYPGRMLMTAAAKFALPVSFKASAEPVGFAGNSPIYLGLQGWGYSLKEPSEFPKPHETSKDTSRSWEPKGWVASFLTENPATSATLSNKGIQDEDSYLEVESDLDQDMRHKLGLFRSHYLMGINYDDPCELSRSAPPWLIERELNCLEIPVRAFNVFKEKDIKTVADLAKWSSIDLLNLQNFGKKTLRDILKALNKALNEGPIPNANHGETTNPSRLLVEMRRSLLSFSGRERDILMKRLGFETSSKTLQEVADDHGVTRERIRQIEAQAIEKWVRESYWDDILEQKLTRFLIGRNYPMPVAGIEAIDPWFEGVSSNLKFFKNLVQVVCKDRIHFLEIDSLLFFSFITQEIWERTISEAKDLLLSGTSQRWSETYAHSLVQGLLPDKAKEFGTILWEKASRLCHFTINKGGVGVLTSYGRGAEQLVEVILAEADTPLHYTEIANRINSKYGKSIDCRRAHNAVANVGFLFARGTYGLAQHIPISDEIMSKVCNIAEDIVCSDAVVKQWHTAEIFSEIPEMLDENFEGLDKYLLEIALSKSKLLRPLGKMTWIVAEHGTNERTRIEIHKAVVALIKAAGRPLTNSEIKERLTALRGVNDFFQITLNDPLIRVQPGVWGLKDRDLSLKPSEQLRLIETLVKELQKRQKGIHASELAHFLRLEDCSPEAFLSIAVKDRRLKSSTSRYVYLADWGTPRVESIAQAVSVVLKESVTPLSMAQIVDRVKHKVKREFDRTIIYPILHALEAKYDGSNGTWRIDRLSIGDEDLNIDAEADD